MSTDEQPYVESACHADHKHARKADQTAQQLSRRELLLPENKRGDQQGKKGAGGRNDGALVARRVGQADIKEGILNDRLHHGKGQDHPAGAALRQQEPAAQKTADQDGQGSREGKAYPGEENLAQGIFPGDGKILIAELDAGRCAAPEQIGRNGGGQDAGKGGKKIGLCCVGLHAFTPKNL